MDRCFTCGSSHVEFRVSSGLFNSAFDLPLLMLTAARPHWWNGTTAIATGSKKDMKREKNRVHQMMCYMNIGVFDTVFGMFIYWLASAEAGSHINLELNVGLNHPVDLHLFQIVFSFCSASMQGEHVERFSHDFTTHMGHQSTAMTGKMTLMVPKHVWTKSHAQHCTAKTCQMILYAHLGQALNKVKLECIAQLEPVHFVSKGFQRLCTLPFAPQEAIWKPV